MAINTNLTAIKGDIMAGANIIRSEQTEIPPGTDEFKAGIVRSMKQYNAGLVKAFDNVDDLLADLHSAE